MPDELFPDLVQAVLQQRESPRTPYVEETFRRLLASGLTGENALEQIALCLGAEMEEMTTKRRAFDEAAYQASLAALPMAEELRAESSTDH